MNECVGGKWRNREGGAMSLKGEENGGVSSSEKRDILISQTILALSV
jgi:hypothetical protein